jgi:hypothetical protein
LKRAKLEESHDKVRLFEKQVKVQIGELKEVASMFQKELGKIQEAEGSIRLYVQHRLEDTEKLFRALVEQVKTELGKTSADTFKELDTVDQEMTKLKAQMILFTKQGGDETSAVKELRQQVLSLREEMLSKANIKDVCALVDIKANSEDLERSFKSLLQEIKALKVP